MDQLLQFSPIPITFEFTPHRQTTTYLSIRNVSEFLVTYKVKTTNPKRYTARPPVAVIEPNEHVDMELTQQALTGVPDDVNNCRDRFQLQVARVDKIPVGEGGGQLRGYESPIDLWTAVPGDVVHEARFSVVLKKANSSTRKESGKEPRLENRFTPSSITTKHEYVENQQKRTDASATIRSITGTVSAAEPKARVLTNSEAGRAASSLNEERETPSLSSPESPLLGLGSALGNKNSEIHNNSPVQDMKTQKETVVKPKDEVDYTSVEYARQRALGIRIAPKISLPSLDKPTRQRVAKERAGELIRAIEARQKDIDKVHRDLSEARHRLSDARVATRPAYDVKYEISESSRVPYAQIAIMAIISGALLQLLV